MNKRIAKALKVALPCATCNQQPRFARGVNPHDPEHPISVSLTCFGCGLEASALGKTLRSTLKRTVRRWNDAND